MAISTPSSRALIVSPPVTGPIRCLFILHSMALAYAVLALLWLALIAYAALGGADFGGGVWDFLAFGPQAERQRRLVGQAMGPVWEANHVWLIFLLVGLFTAFPIVFSILS